MNEGSLGVIVTTIVALGGVFWNRAVRARRFERLAEQLWRHSTRPTEFRAPTADDELLIAQLDATADLHIELERYFRRLGDLVIGGPSAEAVSPIRLYVSLDGAIAAYLLAPTTVIGFESFATGHELVTKRGTRQYIAHPPFVDTEWVEPSTTIAEMVANHRARLPSDLTGLVRMHSLEDVRDELLRSHTRLLEWRAVQDPDDLLAADLRTLLGDEGFRQLGDKWMKRFRKRRAVPRAVVRQPTTTA